LGAQSSQPPAPEITLIGTPQFAAKNGGVNGLVLKSMEPPASAALFVSRVGEENRLDVQYRLLEATTFLSDEQRGHVECDQMSGLDLRQGHGRPGRSQGSYRDQTQAR
jgi:hypothetical protein